MWLKTCPTRQWKSKNLANCLRSLCFCLRAPFIRSFRSCWRFQTDFGRTDSCPAPKPSTWEWYYSSSQIQIAGAHFLIFQPSNSVRLTVRKMVWWLGKIRYEMEGTNFLYYVFLFKEKLPPATRLGFTVAMSQQLSWHKLYILSLCQIHCHATNVGPGLCLKRVSNCHWF